MVGDDVQKAAGSRQLCAGQAAGTEIAFHAIHRLFEQPEVEGALLVDAQNAFNNLNRQVALHNVWQLCPSISTALTNTY